MAFDYVNAKYPPPWDEDTEKLVAFLFGIISHQVTLVASMCQVADISWHSLSSLSDGFLEVLGDILDRPPYHREGQLPRLLRHSPRLWRCGGRYDWRV